MFHHEVMISCLSCGPGKWTSAMAAAAFLSLHPSLCYLVLASRMSPRDCRDSRWWSSILTPSLDYNFTKANSCCFCPSLKRPSTCAVSFYNKLKNSATNPLFMKTTWTAGNRNWNPRDNEHFTGLPVVTTLTFHIPLCCHKGCQDIVLENMDYYGSERQYIQESQNGYFYLSDVFHWSWTLKNKSVHQPRSLSEAIPGQFETPDSPKDWNVTLCDQ